MSHVNIIVIFIMFIGKITYNSIIFEQSYEYIWYISALCNQTSEQPEQLYVWEKCCKSLHCTKSRTITAKCLQ